MPNDKKPTDLKTILKEEAQKYNIGAQTLKEEVRKELCSRIAREIVDKIIAGEVAPPERLKGGVF